MSEYIGHLDTAENGVITGWAALPSDTSIRPNIQFFLNDKAIGSTIANKYRSDLKDAGIGDGCYAFQFQCPQDLICNSDCSLVAKVNSEQLLEGSPILMSFASSAPAANHKYIGSIDTLEGTNLIGWCIDTQAVDQPVSLTLQIDQTPVADINADQYRSDLMGHEGSNGYAAFNYPIPMAYFDNKEHIFTLSINDDNSDSPIITSQSFKLPFINVIQGHSVVEQDGLVQGWYINQQDVDAPVKLDISVNGALLATVSADKYRNDLTEFANHSGRYSFQYLIPNHYYKADTLEIAICLHGTEDALFTETVQCKGFYPYKLLDENVTEQAEQLTKQLTIQPLISILMPTYRSDINYLDMAVESVRQQSYSNWQLCIADDASESPELESYLRKLMASDNRIKVIFRQENGHISAASNSALSLCTGQYTALLDHDDLLHPNALLQVVLAVQNNPNAAIIFSNEDKCDLEGNRFGPYFKKGFDHDLLMEQNLISHLGVYKTELLNKIGGFRVGYEGSQDYDLALRVLKEIDHSQVIHIPEVLYHWRAVPGSTAISINEKSYAAVAFEKARKDYLNTSSSNSNRHII